jgi:predicted nucleic acid-binding protein
VIVVDASVLAPALAYDVPAGDAIRLRLTREEQLFAPEVVDLELASAWRGALRAGYLDEQRSRRALDGLAALRLVRVSHRMLMPRVWELRHDLSPYDAAYVALAETLGATLLTADARSTRAPSLRCTVELSPS